MRCERNRFGDDDMRRDQYAPFRTCRMTGRSPRSATAARIALPHFPAVRYAPDGRLACHLPRLALRCGGARRDPSQPSVKNCDVEAMCVREEPRSTSGLLTSDAASNALPVILRPTRGIPTSSSREHSRTSSTPALEHALDIVPAKQSIRLGYAVASATGLMRSSMKSRSSSTPSKETRASWTTSGHGTPAGDGIAFGAAPRRSFQQSLGHAVRPPCAASFSCLDGWKNGGAGAL